MQIEKPFEISPEKTKTTSSVVDEKEIQFEMKPDDNLEVISLWFIFRNEKDQANAHVCLQ